MYSWIFWITLFCYTLDVCGLSCRTCADDEGNPCMTEPSSMDSQTCTGVNELCMTFLFKDYQTDAVYAFKRMCRSQRGCPHNTDGKLTLDVVMCQESTERKTGRKSLDCRVCCDHDGCNEHLREEMLPYMSTASSSALKTQSRSQSHLWLAITILMIFYGCVL